MGKLVQVATETVTSPTATVTLTGINSDDVYMVAMNNVQLDTTSRNLLYRFTASGTPQTTANYDYAQKTLRADTTFQNESAVNGTYAFVNASTNMGIGTGQTLQSIMYLYNFNNSSEYSFVTREQLFRDINGHLKGAQGGAVYTVAETHNGIHFLLSSTGNIASGTFTLYRCL